MEREREAFVEWGPHADAVRVGIRMMLASVALEPAWLCNFEDRPSSTLDVAFSARGDLSCGGGRMIRTSTRSGRVTQVVVPKIESDPLVHIDGEVWFQAFDGASAFISTTGVVRHLDDRAPDFGTESWGGKQCWVEQLEGNRDRLLWEGSIHEGTWTEVVSAEWLRSGFCDTSTRIYRIDTDVVFTHHGNEVGRVARSSHGYTAYSRSRRGRVSALLADGQRLALYEVWHGDLEGREIDSLSPGGVWGRLHLSEARDVRVAAAENLESYRFRLIRIDATGAVDRVDVSYGDRKVYLADVWNSKDEVCIAVSERLGENRSRRGRACLPMAIFDVVRQAGNQVPFEGQTDVRPEAGP